MSGKKICIIGCNENGILAAIKLSEAGHKVILVDDEDILSGLSKGNLPFYDPDSATATSKAILKRKISLSDMISESVSISEFIFISVHPVILKSGAANLSGMKSAAEAIGNALKKGSKVVIISKVPPGTTDDVISKILERNSGLKASKDFDLAACIILPSKLIVGASRKSSGTEVLSLFEYSKSERILLPTKTAEMLAHLAGCIEAVNVSSINELANLCELLGIDAQEAMSALGINAEKKIGLGYSDPELNSDVSIMTHLSEQVGLRPDLLRAAKKVNDRQALKAIELLRDEIGNLKGKNIALLGLTSKTNTTNVEGSKAFDIAVELLAQGAKVIGYDRLAISEFIKLLPVIEYASSAREALLDSDGCIIQTGDEEFSRLNKQDFDLMKNKTVIDGRRILSPAKMEKFGVSYRAVGLGNKKRKEV